MRLICPNCDAEYEVDAAAIPEGGRDVQCSACGHAWFQLPLDAIAAAEDEAALYDAPEVTAAPSAAAAPAPVPTPAPAPVAPPPAPPAPAPEVAPVSGRFAAQDEEEDDDDLPLTAPPPGSAEASLAATGAGLGRSLDESLMAVLREEAARESAARRAEVHGLETQTEMPLAAPTPTPVTAAPATAVPATAGPGARAALIPSLPALDTEDEPAEVRPMGPAVSALRKIARLRGEPDPVPAKADPARPRRDLLPEIDEINSTLRAAGEKRDVDQGAVADTLAVPRQGGGFRRGFLTVVLLLILGAALYLVAPILSAQVPALAGALTAYVAAVDALRGELDVLARTITATLTGVTGGQG